MFFFHSSSSSYDIQRLRCHLLLLLLFMVRLILIVCLDYYYLYESRRIDLYVCVCILHVKNMVCGRWPKIVFVQRFFFFLVSSNRKASASTATSSYRFVLLSACFFLHCRRKKEGKSVTINIGSNFIFNKWPRPFDRERQRE